MTITAPTINKTTDGYTITWPGKTSHSGTHPTHTAAQNIINKHAPEHTTRSIILTRDLHAALETLIPLAESADTEAIRQVLIHLTEDGTLNLAATNRYTIATVRMDAANQGEPYYQALSTHTARELLDRLPESCWEEGTDWWHENHIRHPQTHLHWDANNRQIIAQGREYPVERPALRWEQITTQIDRLRVTPPKNMHGIHLIPRLLPPGRITVRPVADATNPDGALWRVQDTWDYHSTLTGVCIATIKKDY